MAKIMFSGVAGVDMRNKLNGSVFSKNRYGGYVRTKVTPVNPQTTAQQNARNNLSTWSQNWRALTESQRQSWIDGAPNFPFTDIFGNSKTLSGQALYVKLNINLLNSEATPLETCPSPVGIPAITALSLVADDSANTVIATITSEATSDYSYFWYATPNVTPGKTFVKNLFRFIGFDLGTVSSPVDLSARWTALFGDPVEGQKIFLKVLVMSNTTGQMGIPIQTQTIVVA